MTISYDTFFLGLIYLVTALVIYWQLKELKKNRRVENLLTLMIFLHRPELVEARFKILSNKNNRIDEEVARLVCSNFDFAGFMVKESMLEDQAAFFRYWTPVFALFKKRLNNFLCDTCFPPNITGKEYWKHFSWLLEEASKYSPSPKDDDR